MSDDETLEAIAAAGAQLASDAYHSAIEQPEVFGDSAHGTVWKSVVAAVVDWYETEGFRLRMSGDAPADAPAADAPADPLVFEEYTSSFAGRVRVESDESSQTVALFLYAPIDSDSNAMSGFGLWIDLPCALAVARDLEKRVLYLSRGTEVATLAGERDKEAGRVVWRKAPPPTVWNPKKDER